VRGSIVRTLQDTTLADLLVTPRLAAPAASIAAPLESLSSSPALSAS